MKRAIFFKVFLILLLGTGCAKNNYEKYILGQWEVQEVFLHYESTNPQIQQDFEADLYYFKKVIFYKNNQVYIDYAHEQPKLGTYTLAPYVTSQSKFTLEIKHFPLKDSTFQKKFDFHQTSFFLNKLNRNKMILQINYSPGGDQVYQNLIFNLKKTGVFEKE
jgi:hypothetical protein